MSSYFDLDALQDGAKQLFDRVDFSFPTAVYHPNDPDVPGDKWNQGVGHNPGVLISATKDIGSFHGVNVYTGIVAGSVKNSEFERSDVLGGVVGAEKFISSDGSLSVRTDVMAGGVTGYATEKNDYNPNSVEPGAIFNASLVKTFNGYSVGARASWIPSKTLGDSPSDAYVVSVDLGAKF